MLTSAFTKDGLAPGGVVLHPRSYVKIVTWVDGEAVDTGIQPKSFSHHRASHNKADEARITIDTNAFDFPIRLIAGADVSLYYGLVEEASDGLGLDTTGNLRFIGNVVDYEIDHEGKVASLEAQDLSYLCRRKNYPVRKTEMTDKDGNTIGTVDPTPRYSDTLKEAVKRLLSMLPDFVDKSVAPPLVVRDRPGLTDVKLGTLVNGRASQAPISLRPNSTVWEAIEYLCGLVGFHVKVDLNEIVIRSSQEVFAGRSSKCTFIFGGPNGNCCGPKFHKKPQANRRGILVSCWDPETRQEKTAVWPSDSELKQILKKDPKHPKAPAKATSKKIKRAPDSEPRDVQELDPCHYTHKALEEKAKAIYLERSRQEADGTVATPIWTKEILGLSNGDFITVKVNADLTRQIELIGDDTAAAKLLMDLGYEKAAADTLVRAARKRSLDDWYCKEITFEHPSEHLATVKFINLVEY